MIKVTLYFLLIVIILGLNAGKLQDDQLLVNAFIDVVFELFISQNIQYDTIIYDKVTPHINEVINGLGRGGSITRLSFSNYTREKTNHHFTVVQSAIILCESFKEIQKFLYNHELG